MRGRLGVEVSSVVFCGAAKALFCGTFLCFSPGFSSVFLHKPGAASVRQQKDTAAHKQLAANFPQRLGERKGGQQLLSYPKREAGTQQGKEHVLGQG